MSNPTKAAIWIVGVLACLAVAAFFVPSARESIGDALARAGDALATADDDTPTPIKPLDVEWQPEAAPTASTPAAVPDWAAADREAAAALAAKLLPGLPEKFPNGRVRLAIRPLGRDADGLSEDVGTRLYEALLDAFVNAAKGAKGAVEVVPRNRLDEIYGTMEEFYQGDIETVLRKAQANVEVVCTPTVGKVGVTLHCAAIHLQGDPVITLSHGSAGFNAARELQEYNLAVQGVAERLANGAKRPGTLDDGAVVINRASGRATALGDYSARRMQAVIRDALAKLDEQRAGEERVAEALGTPHPATTDGAVTYKLKVETDLHDEDHMRLDAKLVVSGNTLVSAGADISLATVPENLRRDWSGSSTRRDTGKRYEAEAAAVVSTRLDEDAALRASRNLARARMITQALGTPSLDIDEIEDEVDAVRVLLDGFPSQGITFNEQFQTLDTGPDRVAVRLVAEVVAVGTSVRPSVKAEFDRASNAELAIYAEGEKIEFTLRSESAAHVGIFYWGADDKVSRLYPNAKRSIEVGADDTVALPGKNEDHLRTFVMDPESNREDHEALVVVAASEAINFEKLAAPVPKSADASRAEQTASGEFLDRLANAPPARLSVQVLPLLVHRSVTERATGNGD